MSADKQARLLQLDALADTEVLRGIFSSAEDEDLLREVLPLVATMTGTDLVAELADLAETRGLGELVAVARAAADG